MYFLHAFFNRFWKRLGRVLGEVWDLLGVSWGTFKRLFSRLCCQEDPRGSKRRPRGLLDSIWGGFGGVWGGVWDPKIVAFRIFFDVFSMSKSKCVLKREKIAQKIEKSKLFHFLAPGLRCRGGPGEREKERGVRILAEEFRRRISRSYRRCRLTIQHAVAHQGGAAD